MVEKTTSGMFENPKSKSKRLIITTIERANIYRGVVDVIKAHGEKVEMRVIASSGERINQSIGEIDPETGRRAKKEIKIPNEAIGIQISGTEFDLDCVVTTSNEIYRKIRRTRGL